MACRKTGHFCFLLNGVNANANCQKNSVILQ